MTGGSSGAVSAGAVGAAALAGILFGFDTAVISGVATPMADALALDETGKGAAVSAALWGTLVAAVASGPPGDRYGAHAMLRLVAVLFILSAVGCALATGFWTFALFRFAGGLAIGGASVLAPVYIAEISPAARRGALVGMFQVSIVAGILLAYLSNAAITALLAAPNAWRWKLAVMAAPGVAFLLAMLVLPPSPRWLAARGRTEEAEAAARRLDLGEWSAFATRPAERAALSWSRHRKPILLALAVASFNQLSGINAILYYLNDIFAAAGFDQSAADLQAVAIGVTNLAATLAAMAVIDRIGRRTLLLVGSIGCAVALAGVALVYSATGAEALLLPLLILFIASFAFSQGAVIWVFLSEIFPTEVRARGQALGSATHWIWAAVLSLGFPVVAERYDQALPFWLFAGAMIVQFFVVWRFFPETRGVALENMGAAIGSPQRESGFGHG